MTEDVIDISDVEGLGLGLCGAHRTGKTTIARELVKVNGLPMASSSTSQVAFDMGIDLTTRLDFKTRLAFQERVFDVHDELWGSFDGMFIADRTPIDLAAYLLADIPNNLDDPDLITQALAYTDKCFRSANRHFFTVALIQPGLPYLYEPGKPLPNKAYQEQHNTICTGLLYDNRYHRDLIILNRECLELSERCVLVAQSAKAALGQVYQHARSLPG